MIKTTNDLLTAIIDDDAIFDITLELATLDRRELLDTAMLHRIARNHNTSPARITRIAQILSHDESYAAIAQSLDFCPIHRCDIEICIDDDITECAHLR